MAIPHPSSSAAVAQFSDSVLHAVAEAEVVLPINEQVEDSSTIAPEVNDGIFDREKALRLDDEIMNFQWISTIPWSDINDLRGSTVVQPLARLRCALQQTQHAILRAILHHGSSSRGSQPAWEVVLLSSSWVQPRTQQTAIGPVSWKHDWTSSGLKTRQRLWTMVRAECDATTITQASSEGQRRTNRRSQDPQKDALARAGERDAARNAAPVPVTSEIVWKIKGLHSIDPDPAPATTQISHIFIARIAEFKPHATPQRTRPSGYAHRALGRLRHQAGHAILFSLVIASIATASMPDAVFQYLRAGLVTPLLKPAQGH